MVSESVSNSSIGIEEKGWSPRPGAWLLGRWFRKPPQGFVDAGLVRVSGPWQPTMLSFLFRPSPIKILPSNSAFCIKNLLQHSRAVSSNSWANKTYFIVCFWMLVCNSEVTRENLRHVLSVIPIRVSTDSNNSISFVYQIFDIVKVELFTLVLSFFSHCPRSITTFIKKCFHIHFCIGRQRMIICLREALKNTLLTEFDI